MRPCFPELMHHRTLALERHFRGDKRCTPCTATDTSPRARTAPSCKGLSSASCPRHLLSPSRVLDFAILVEGHSHVGRQIVVGVVSILPAPRGVQRRHAPTTPRQCHVFVGGCLKAVVENGPTHKRRASGARGTSWRAHARPRAPHARLRSSASRPNQPRPRSRCTLATTPARILRFSPPRP